MPQSDNLRPYAVRPHVRDGKPSGKWQLDTPPHLSASGRRTRETFDTRDAAIQEARKRLQRLAMGHMPVAPAHGGRRVSGIRLSQLAEMWSEDRLRKVELGKRTAGTFATNLYHLKALLPFLGNDDIGLLDEKRLEEYQAHRLKDGRAARTINSEIGTLKLTLGWAKKQHLIAAVPEVQELTVERPILDLPTIEEMGRIVRALPERLRPLILAFAETGCRKSELLWLPWEHVDELRGAIWIRKHEGRGIKNDPSERLIPISEQLLNAIRMLPKTGRYVFPGRDGESPITDFRKAFATAVKNAEVLRDGRPMHITPHMIRKAYATWQAERGIEETTLQVLLGHVRGSKVTRQVYINPQLQARRGAVFELPLSEQPANDGSGNMATAGNKPHKAP